MDTFYTNVFNLIIVSSTCFEHPSVHPQEDLYMQFYGISFMHPSLKHVEDEAQNGHILH
jgi:hypothetical protein